MNDNNFDYEIISDGSFYLDAGAYFGVVPKAIWKSHFSDEDNMVKLSTNVIFLDFGDYSALIDSGLGNSFDEKTKKIYRISKESDIFEYIKRKHDPDSVRMIVNSHLHFDHTGHNLDFHNAFTYAQKDEFMAIRYKNPVTRSNYWLKIGDIKNRAMIDGSKRISRNIRVIKTGGHSAGHQAILIDGGSVRIMYFGDILPSTFHLKLPYRTAIDIDPLRTVKLKEALVKKAIRDHYLCVFDHDATVKSAYLSGDYSNPKFEAVDL
ncbi:MAG: MBL fold metallo-hydrolase [Thermoplasmata archaeon]